MESEYQRDSCKRTALRMKEIKQNENFLEEKKGKQRALTVGHILAETGGSRSCE